MCVQRLEKLEELLAEKSSALKHVELQLSKSNIELETKSVHVESLLQESGEVHNLQCGSMMEMSFPLPPSLSLVSGEVQ